MLFESISWVMLTLMLLVAVPGALAAPAKRPKKTVSTRITVEAYPAMEDGEIIVPRQASIPALEPAALPKMPKAERRARTRVQTLGAPAPIAAPVSVASAPIPKFEAVPESKRAQVLVRMRLCQSLFEATGRAYDYRTMTTTELQRELDAVQNGPAIAAAGNTAPADELSDASDPILDEQE